MRVQVHFDDVNPFLAKERLEDDPVAVSIRLNIVRQDRTVLPICEPKKVTEVNACHSSEISQSIRHVEGTVVLSNVVHLRRRRAGVTQLGRRVIGGALPV